MFVPSRFVFVLVLVALASFVSPGASGAGWFTPPEAPWVAKAGQSAVLVSLPAGPVEKAQALIDEARLRNPDAHLVLTATGNLEVTRNPLKLGSRMNLRLSPTAGIVAGAGASAASLVSIVDAEQVSIVSDNVAAAVLDGGKNAIAGIVAEKSIRLHFDQLRIQNCGEAGLRLLGRSADAVNEASSVARCVFVGNGAGLEVSQSAALMCLDNRFTGHAGSALALESLCAVVSGNTFRDNAGPVRLGSDRAVIARNTVDDAVEFTAAGSGILFSENQGRSRRIVLAGRDHQLFQNHMPAAVTVDAAAHGMVLVSNSGFEAPAPDERLKIFNPPALDATASAKPTKVAIIPGRPRHDISVPGGMPVLTDAVDEQGKKYKAQSPGVPVDIAIVQKAIDEARAAHPDAVLVVSLKGEYVVRTPEGLTLPPDTCVLLLGRIRSDFGGPLNPRYDKNAPISQVVRLPQTGFVSWCGGTLDAGHQAFHPVLGRGGALAVINNVNLVNGARDGVCLKFREMSVPAFIYRSNVSGNGGRGIWNHVAGRVHSIANNCSGNASDGVDIDALARDGTALFNTCSGNGRHGVFIEEGVRHSITFGNNLFGNRQAGVHVWNQLFDGDTGANVIAANRATGNRRGISVGGRAAERTATGNLFFNNVCLDNWSEGVCVVGRHAADNYWAQVISERSGVADVANSEATTVFFSTAFPEAR